MEPRNTFNKNQEVRRKRRMRVLVVLLLLIIALVGAGIGFLRKPSFQISDIAVTNAKSLDGNAIEISARKHISGFYALVIPKSNGLLFSKSAMNKFLLQEFPGIESVDTEFLNRNSVAISIVEKKPSYLWCTVQCYFVDNSGMIYENAPVFTPGFFLGFSGITSGGTITDPSDPIRRRFASAAEFDRTLSVVNFLAAKSVHVINAKYLSTADSTQEIATGDGDEALTVDQIGDAIVPSTAKFYILQSEGPQDVGQSLSLVLLDKDFQSKLAADPGSLQYIDLRFNGKIYYKFAGAVTAPTVPTAVSSAPAKPATAVPTNPAATAKKKPAN
ncbi:MAG: hypothetical protein JWM20_3 [Patescibacteria group bacterium]|nr:hypothetical protein [Patescibacteria group bacterium]